jgi:hypothetical protein
MSSSVPMSLDRLRAILQAYGAEPDRWPPDERSAALALLSHTPEAQRWRDASGRLDALLDQAPSHRGSSALTARILAAIPARTTIRTASLNRRLARRIRVWPAIRIAIPLAAAALVLWLVSKPPEGPELAHVAYAEIGTYQTPTDVLLDLPSVRALDGIPVFGCTAEGLGCLDSGVPTDQSHSALDSERYV